MTIGIGIVCSDGIILAADAEISTNGEIKGSDTKLVAATTKIYTTAKDVSIALAGAGSLGYFQSLRIDAMTEVLAALDVPADGKDHVRERLEEFMTNFHLRHVIPYAAFDPPPEVYVLAASSLNGEHKLWASERGTVHSSDFGYEAIGIGATFAMSLLHSYYCPMNVESAAILAAYVVYRVKHTVQWCGQDTHMLVLRNGKAAYLEREVGSACESEFAHLNWPTLIV